MVMSRYDQFALRKPVPTRHNPTPLDLDNLPPSRKSLKKQAEARDPNYIYEWIGGRLYRSKWKVNGRFETLAEPELVQGIPERPKSGKKAHGLAAGRPAASTYTPRESNFGRDRAEERPFWMR